VKENTLVEHDILKLDTRKKTEKLENETDKVFGLENRKQQLKMSMDEREKEINVHAEILKAESRAAEEERHKVKIELSERHKTVNNLKIK
jgi:hypothetical protein